VLSDLEGTARDATGLGTVRRRGRRGLTRIAAHRCGLLSGRRRRRPERVGSELARVTVVCRRKFGALTFAIPICGQVMLVVGARIRGGLTITGHCDGELQMKCRRSTSRGDVSKQGTHVNLVVERAVLSDRDKDRLVVRRDVDGREHVPARPALTGAETVASAPACSRP